MRLVVIFVFEHANLLDIAGPLQVFATASEEAVSLGAPQPPYEILIASMQGGPVRTSCGVELMTHPVRNVTERNIDTLLVSGGGGVETAVKDADILNWLAAARRRVRRIGSICTGAFLLASAGCLEGRRATTHWAFCSDLECAHSGVQVVSDALFIEDGGVWTSAGVTAGIDMALALVEQDNGSSLALETARQLVLFLKRSGGQPQFSSFLRAQAVSDNSLRRLVEWILQDPSADLDAEAMAKRANMSLRSLFRAFHEHLETTPREFVERARLETARRLLEQSDERVDAIARKAGFRSAEAMRRAFRRQFQVSPLSYRERFSALRAHGGSPDALADLTTASFITRPR